MTALPGAGALPGRVGTLGPGAAPALGEVLVDEGEELFVSLSCCVNGSLLANLLNDANWPSCRAGAGADASGLVEPDVVTPGAKPVYMGCQRVVGRK